MNFGEYLAARAREQKWGNMVSETLAQLLLLENISQEDKELFQHVRDRLWWDLTNKSFSD